MTKIGTISGLAPWLSGVFGAAFVAWGLLACGGGGTKADAGSLTGILSQTGAALPKAATIVVRFSASMNPASLQLGGTLVAESKAAAWSKTNADNDTLTLSAQTGNWTSGPDRTLTVDAKDVAGNTLATLYASYVVPLAFDNFQGAAVVIGQSNFIDRTVNQGGTAGPNTLAGPYGNPAVTAEGRLFLSDCGNNRVLGYNSLPTSNNANADFVLGQSDFLTATGDTKLGSHWCAHQVLATEANLIVSDWASYRVVIYNSVPTSGTAVQSVVVGQLDFTSRAGGCTAASLVQPEAAAVTPDGRFIVTDSGNHRILIWNALPTTNGQPADVVLGQADFTHCISNDDNQNGISDATSSARTLNYPSGVWTDGTRLVVSDLYNHRVLIWNRLPTSSFQRADLVLGQANFERNTANDDNQDGNIDAQPTARTLGTPYSSVSSNGVQLAVADSDNNRVLIWNSFPTSNFQAADVVLGQADFNHHGWYEFDYDPYGPPVSPHPSARTLRYPSGLLFYRDKLLVQDSDNSRVLIFNSK